MNISIDVVDLTSDVEIPSDVVLVSDDELSVQQSTVIVVGSDDEGRATNRKYDIAVLGDLSESGGDGELFVEEELIEEVEIEVLEVSDNEGNPDEDEQEVAMSIAIEHQGGLESIRNYEADDEKEEVGSLSDWSDNDSYVNGEDETDSELSLEPPLPDANDNDVFVLATPTDTSESDYEENQEYKASNDNDVFVLASSDGDTSESESVENEKEPPVKRVKRSTVTPSD